MIEICPKKNSTKYLLIKLNINHRKLEMYEIEYHLLSLIAYSIHAHIQAYIAIV